VPASGGDHSRFGEGSKTDADGCRPNCRGGVQEIAVVWSGCVRKKPERLPFKVASVGLSKHRFNPAILTHTPTTDPILNLKLRLSLFGQVRTCGNPIFAIAYNSKSGTQGSFAKAEPVVASVPPLTDGIEKSRRSCNIPFFVFLEVQISAAGVNLPVVRMSNFIGPAQFSGPEALIAHLTEETGFAVTPPAFFVFSWKNRNK
jgi:hypothetical protein